MALAGVPVRVSDVGGSNLVEIDMLVTADAVPEVPSAGWDLFSAEPARAEFVSGVAGRSAVAFMV